MVPEDKTSSDQDNSSNEEQGRVLRRIEITIPRGKEPERLDQFLTRQVSELTRTKVQELINTDGVKVDGKSIKPSHKVRPGQLIELTVLTRPPLEIKPEPIPLNVVWEDEWLVVIDKPAGMVVHPAAGNRTGTLVNALLAHYQELASAGDPDRPGLVHRLDKNTSGLLVICRKEPALSRMAELFRNHTVEREYHAITWWHMPKRKGVIDKPIGRDRHDRKKMQIRADGKVARTHWSLIEKFNFLCYLALKLETGRTHQIRVHLLSEGHPVFGDPDYGGRNRQMGRLTAGQRRVAAEYFEKVDRQLLHARTLGFIHPITKKELRFESPLPEDFSSMLEELREVSRR